MYRFIVKGTVQGVGFRPYIYNACARENVSGYIRNTSSGVEIVADNKEKIENILKNPPALARIDSINVETADIVLKHSGFRIIESSDSSLGKSDSSSGIPADLYLCKDCQKELNAPQDKRHGYFFITCTSCGPRYTIIDKLPYDRPNTSMSEFKMCDFCKSEYEEPSNRRYHAQTVACGKCGPALELFEDGKKTECRNPVEECARLIKKGALVAIKGIGGFHIACKLSSVNKLRMLTKRRYKPFAVMARDMEMVRSIAVFDDAEKRLLESSERPIVVLRKRNAPDFKNVSELDTIGVMLPYTGLHYLLFNHIDFPIIMTSSNMPDEPITKDSGAQFTRYALSHTRRIANTADDSVLKVVSGKSLFLRRSRGFVPRPIDIPASSPQDIKCAVSLGSEINNAICVLNGGKAYLSSYIGNTYHLKTYESLVNKTGSFLKFLNAKPQVVMCDMNPQYNTSAYAKELSEKLGVPLVMVQHHLAHIYSVAAEKGMFDVRDFSGIACDGAGLGSDGNVWGGEIFYAGKRVGSLEEQILPGGDSSAIYPQKMLFSILSKFMDDSEISRYVSLGKKDISLLSAQIKHKVNCPATTSTGRILDAAAAFLGICNYRDYEGRPAMLLESVSTKPYDLAPVVSSFSGRKILETTPIFRFLAENRDKDKGRLAATVEQYIAEGMHSIAGRFSENVVFSGGCAYNRIMSGYMIGKGVFVNEKVPCGDGGISFGQVASLFYR